LDLSTAKGEKTDVLRTHVMLVDDEEALLKAVGQYLEGRGFLVTAVSSAPEAYDLLQRQPKLPDVLVSDITMPKVDGYTFVQKLRSKPEFALLPVIFLTARGMTPDRIKGYKSGANAYISKPFDPEELVSVIDSVVSNQRRLVDVESIDSLRQELVALRTSVERQRETQLFTKENTEPISLTGREESVLQCLSRGMTNKEIAETLGLSLRYIEKVIERLLQKTNTTNRTKLVRYALDTGLI